MWRLPNIEDFHIYFCAPEIVVLNHQKKKTHLLTADMSVIWLKYLTKNILANTKHLENSLDEFKSYSLAQNITEEIEAHLYSIDLLIATQ